MVDATANIFANSTESGLVAAWGMGGDHGTSDVSSGCSLELRFRERVAPGLAQYVGLPPLGDGGLGRTPQGA